MRATIRLSGNAQRTSPPHSRHGPAILDGGILANSATGVSSAESKAAESRSGSTGHRGPVGSIEPLQIGTWRKARESGRALIPGHLLRSLPSRTGNRCTEVHSGTSDRRVHAAGSPVPARPRYGSRQSGNRHIDRTRHDRSVSPETLAGFDDPAPHTPQRRPATGTRDSGFHRGHRSLW